MDLSRHRFGRFGRMGSVWFARSSFERDPVCCRLKKHLDQDGIASVSIYTDRTGHSRRPALAGQHNACRLGGPKRDYLYSTRLESELFVVGEITELEWGQHVPEYRVRVTHQVLTLTGG
jgi:hypothetical protein